MSVATTTCSKNRALLFNNTRIKGSYACWQILSSHLHNVYKVQIFMENKLLRSVLQPFSSAQTLAHELLKAHTSFTVSLSAVTAFRFFWRVPRMMTYAPN